MKRLWFLALILVPGVVAAQTDLNAEASGAGPADRTQIPSTARYEVFRTFALSSLALKLDKYDGIVYELVTNRGFIKSKDDSYAWQKTRRTAHPQDTGKIPGQVNYQLTASESARSSSIFKPEPRGCFRGIRQRTRLTGGR